MEPENIGTLKNFKLACISNDLFTDIEISHLSKYVVLGSEDEVFEFSEILKKYRPKVYESLFIKSEGRKMTDDERWEQAISFAYGNTCLHNPQITRDLVRKIANSLRDGGV